MLKSDLVVNLDNLKKFVDTLCLPLKDDEVYIAMLVARKKYGGVSRSEEMLDYTIITRNERIVPRIRKLAYIGDPPRYKSHTLSQVCKEARQDFE